MSKVIDVSNVPGVINITNETDHEISLPLFPNDSFLTLGVGDKLVYKVETSQEYLFYYIACAQLGLTCTEVGY